MTTSPPSESLRALFARMRGGDAGALKEIVDLLYRELHGLAAGQMRGEKRNHTLQTTALVHEVYMRLMPGADRIEDRHHFMALAATAMRRALVDHARQKRAHKRGKGAERVPIDDVDPAGKGVNVVDVIGVDAALTSLALEDPRAAQVVELKFFGGYTDEEIAGILQLSLPTVRRDWKTAKRWLKEQL